MTVRERADLQRVARGGLESLIDRSVPDGPVATLLRKIEAGLDHWLTFVGEPVVLRKIIGTLHNDRGVFIHETVLYLVATCRQQGRNPDEELRRVVSNNEMISRAHAVPAVETSG